MAVCTLDEYRLAVYQKLAVLDAHVSESDLDSGSFSDALLVGNRHFKIVQFRSLCCPQTRLLNDERTLDEIASVLIAERSCLCHRMIDLDCKCRILRVSKSYVNCRNAFTHVHAHLCCTVSRRSYFKVLNAVLFT